MTSGWQSVRASARRMGLIVRGHEHPGAAGDALRHAEAAPGHVAPVVDGVGHAVQVEQLAELAVELEAGLVLAEVGVAAAAVGRQELGPVDDLVDDRRHVVLPAAGAAEVEVVLAARVAVEQAFDVAPQVALGEDRLGDVEPSLEAQPVGDLGVDLLDAVEPELAQHGLLGGRRRVGDVRVDEGSVCHLGRSLSFLRSWRMVRGGQA